MFTTIEQTKTLTGYDVSLENIMQAQGIIESYTGKVEEEVESPNDKAVLGRATAYQAAYMKDNYTRIFEQIAVRKIAQTDGGMSLNEDMGSPFIAPLAYFALRALSWRGSRSVKVGSTFGGPAQEEPWEVV